MELLCVLAAVLALFLASAAPTSGRPVPTMYALSSSISRASATAIHSFAVTFMAVSPLPP